MNSNTLRIRGSDTSTKVNTSFDPVIISRPYKILLSEKNEIFKEFLETNSEKQLTMLKQILFNVKENCNYDTVEFLVIVYLQADIKHPAKCMISRFVSKNNFIQSQFTEILTKEIDCLIDKPCTDYKSYVYVISKVTSCIENFPAGSAAVKNVEIKLAKYFKSCLHCCVSTLRDIKPIAPTEKNEIFTLAHSTLRLLLYKIQKISQENIPNLLLLFDEIKNSLKHLLHDGDAPMDTKSVCGILFVSMHIMENNSNSWIDVLSSHNDNNFKDIFNDESAKLSIYSALVTVVPMEKLKTKLPDGEPAIIKITNNILNIGERCSADATITLSVCRALVALSRAPGAAAGLPGALLAALWPALEHRADAVQQLAAHALRHLVRHCDSERRNGNNEAMEKLFSKLVYLDRERKSFYVSLTSLTNVLGADSIIQKWPHIVTELIAALHIQSVQASATTALETLLQKHVQTSSSDIIFEHWVKQILCHVNNDAIDSAVMNILESLLVLALKLDSDLVDYFLPHIQSSCAGTSPPHMRTLLISVSALRRAGCLPRLGGEAPAWRGALPYQLLELAAVDCSEENRILCISLIVESPKSTEIFTKGELDLVLWFLKYNINAQEPHFRQRVLSIMKKFTKRLESSHKVLIRENHTNGQYYLTFIDQLQDFCFDSLIQGANYSRRYVALQLLVWVDGIVIGGYTRTWKDHEIETLLYHLGDSYEGNKALALELLCHCPVDMLKSRKYSTSLELSDILAEASSVKPTDCVSAVYKLKLLRNILPEYIIQGIDSQAPNKVKFALLLILLEEFEKQLSLCKQSIVYGARNAPMYGLLHCIGHSVETINPLGLSSEVWSGTVARVAARCASVWACARAVLRGAAPEGHLPARGDQGRIPLEDGKEVTAQMVLLCAWRSIKEVSLILGNLVTQALIHDEFEPATLRSQLVRGVGELFTTLLIETKHRGAFEQVYVGFTKMLTSLWRSLNPEFNELPKLWLEELISAIESGDPNGRLCSTRRSAGVPFMIQALVITELQVKSNPSGFDACVSRLLRLAGGCGSVNGSGSVSGSASGISVSDGSWSVIDNSSNGDKVSGNSVNGSGNSTGSGDGTGDVSGRSVDDNSANGTGSVSAAGADSGVCCQRGNVDISGNSVGDSTVSGTGSGSGAAAGVAARCHALNVLRALVRERALHERVAPHAAAALLLALRGFERDSWLDRNSATLLFSALMVRIFGVQRTKDSENLCVRNRMTGRIFFLRYPKLYDFMLEKLREVSEDNEERLLHPSLYPILLLLARLYPSSLEGTVSNLKLSSFVPLVRECAQSAVLTTRRLAARAVPALVEPERYIFHIEELFELLCDTSIKRNYCHGILLQLIKLLESKPEKLTIDKSQTRLLQLIKDSDWILQQGLGDVPCYSIADEYVKMVNILIWRFNSLIEQDFIDKIQKNLNELIFNSSKFNINPGKELCLANAAYLYLIISRKYENVNDIPQFVYKCLAHRNYEVILTVLNYLLILNRVFEVENNFQKHLNEISDDFHIFENDPKYVENLCEVLKTSKYLECLQKCLKLLTLKNDTTKLLIKAKMNDNCDISDNSVIDKLLYYIDCEHENLSHYYLSNLCNFLCAKMERGEVNGVKLLEGMRVIFSCSLPNNSVETRTAVVEFLEKGLNMVPGFLNMNLDGLNEEDQFELRSLSLCCVVSGLHDDEASLRARLARALSSLVQTSRVQASHVRTSHTHTAHALLRVLGSGAADTLLLAVVALLDFRVEVCASDELDMECRVFDQNEKYNIYLEETIWARGCARRIKEVCKEEHLCEYLYDLINKKKYRRTFEKLCGDNFIMFEKSIKGSKDNISPKVEIFIDTLKST